MHIFRVLIIFEMIINSKNMQQCSILNLKLYFATKMTKSCLTIKRMQIVEIRTVAKSLPLLR